MQLYVTPGMVIFYALSVQFFSVLVCCHLMVNQEIGFTKAQNLIQPSIGFQLAYYMFATTAKLSNYADSSARVVVITLERKKS